MKGLFLTLVFSNAAMAENLIKQESQDSSAGLSAESYQEREKVLQELWAQGEEALDYLNEQAEGSDPEAAWRARKILRWMNLRITPDTPKNVVSLIENYLKANTAQERDTIYRQLLEEKAYSQLFRLPASIEDKAVRESLEARVIELAGAVARDLILEDKDEEALAILADAKLDEAGQLRWVSLATAMGKREELWPDLSSKDQMRFARWAGDFELMKQLAPEDHEVLRTLRILEGDPMPYLKSQNKLTPDIKLRSELAQAYWKDEENGKRAKIIRTSLRQSLKSGKGEVKQKAFQTLAQSGSVADAMSYFEVNHPIELFNYYQRSERLDLAFEVFGLKAGEPVPEKWIEQTLEMVAGEWDLSNEGCAKLTYLGLFLFERGKTEEGEQILRRLLDRLEAKQNENETYGFLQYIAGGGSTVPTSGAIDFALQAASEFQQKIFEPRNFLMTIFGERDSVSEFYSFVEKEEPELSEWDHVRAVYAFFGYTVNFPQETSDRLAKTFEERAVEDNRSADWIVLQESASYRGDAALLERAMKALLKFDRDDKRYASELAGLYYADGRYDEAADLWLEILESSTPDTAQMGFAIICLTEAGRMDEAKKLLSQMEKLALGDGQWLVVLSELWLRIGEAERSYQYDARALCLLPAGGSQWYRQLNRVAQSAQVSGHWKAAAASRQVYEVMRPFDFYPSPLYYLDNPSQIAYSRGMAALEDGEQARASEHFERAVATGGFSGYFADELFMELRAAGQFEEVEKIWGELSPVYRRSLELYPDSHNAFNTAAWVASRAAQDIDEAMAWSKKALELVPNSSAYLDTKAETLFAKGNREEALKFSEKACQNSRGVEELSQIRIQYRHFRDDDFYLPAPKMEEPE